MLKSERKKLSPKANKIQGVCEGVHAIERPACMFCLLFNILFYLSLQTFNQLVKMLLNHLFQNGQISPEFYKTFSNEVRQALIALINILAEEQKTAEEKIRNDPKYKNDPVAMEKALEKLPSKFATRLVSNSYRRGVLRIFILHLTANL
jgi:hypothetical protein